MGSSGEQLVMLFDGECPLCRAWANFVVRHDTHSRFRCLPRGSEAAVNILNRVGLERDEPASIAVFIGNHLHTRSDAILCIVASLGFPWRLLRYLRLVPRPIRDAVYGFVARNRQRLGCRAAKGRRCA